MQFLKEGIVTVGVAIVMWVICRGLWLRGPGRKRNSYTTSAHELLLLLVVCYIAGVLAIVIVPVAATRVVHPGVPPNNFTPLRTIRETIDAIFLYPDDLIRHDTANLGGNILLFIPAGFLLPFFFARLRTFVRTALAAALLSAMIELTQLLSRKIGVVRTVDVDDVILNTLGACVGYVIWRWWRSRDARVRL
jgi:glycopeptide antibiotics resistance protein